MGGLFSADGALFNIWDCAGEGAIEREKLFLVPASLVWRSSTGVPQWLKPISNDPSNAGINACSPALDTATLKLALVHHCVDVSGRTGPSCSRAGEELISSQIECATLRSQHSIPVIADARPGIRNE